MTGGSTRRDKWGARRGALMGWLAAVCGLAALSAPGFWFMGVAWSFLLLLCATPLLLIAGALVIGSALAAWRQRRAPIRAALTALSAPCVVVLGFALFLPTTAGVTYGMTCGVLLLNHGRYERIVRQVALAPGSDSGPMLDERLRDGTSVYAERRAPHRVIFELTGWNDLSSGILYDPTGRGASGPPVGEESLGPCLPIWARYYSCSFQTG